MSFSHLGLSKDLLQSIDYAGYKVPSFVQEACIPVVLKGQDLMAQAPTGSGKTAAYVLPILQMLSIIPEEKKRSLKVLILTPTRELAQQVAGVIKVLARSLPRPPRTVTLIGGLNIDLQIRELQHGADLAIATPGRLLDLIKRGAAPLQLIKVVVLDEADRMLDMGFADELKNVFQALPAVRQNLLFSATLNEGVDDVSHNFMNNPVLVEAPLEMPTVERITQRAIEVNRTNRGPLLRNLIRSENWQHVLVFVASIRGADILAAKLRKDGIEADAFHGGMTQAQRNTVLNDFKKQTIKVLVATDLAARGIDIHQLPCVVNYDLPRSPNDYIHRIGRTARAGEKGVAVSFIGHEDKAHFVLIEKRMKLKLQREQVQGYELIGVISPASTGKVPVKGRRMSKKDKARALLQKAG